MPVQGAVLGTARQEAACPVAGAFVVMPAESGEQCLPNKSLTKAE